MITEADILVILVMLGHVKPAVDKHGPLNADCRYHHVESNGAIGILLQKCHQKSETDENHHVDILEKYRYENRE